MASSEEKGPSRKAPQGRVWARLPVSDRRPIDTPMFKAVLQRVLDNSAGDEAAVARALGVRTETLRLWLQA